MSIIVKVPKQAVTVTTWKNKQGQDVPISTFLCEHDGVEKSPCQAFGARKEQLDEAQARGTLEVESITWNAERNRWDVKLPKNSGGEAGFRSKWDGNKRPFVPNGYKGRAMSLDAWAKHSQEVFDICLNMVVTAAPKLTASPNGVPPEILLNAAVNLWQSHYTAMRDNVVFAKDCEPLPAAAEPAASAAQPQAATAPASVNNPAAAGYRAALATGNAVMVKAMLAGIRGDDTLDAPTRMALVVEAETRLAALGGAA